VPLHLGPWSAGTAVPKRPGLVFWVAVGLVAYIGAGVLGPARTADLAARAGLTIALAAILVTQTVAVVAAVTRSRRG
jgi:hypothetical protein